MYMPWFKKEALAMSIARDLEADDLGDMPRPVARSILKKLRSSSSSPKFSSEELEHLLDHLWSEVYLSEGKDPQGDPLDLSPPTPLTKRLRGPGTYKDLEGSEMLVDAPGSGRMWIGHEGIGYLSSEQADSLVDQFINREKKKSQDQKMREDYPQLY